jgi:hypothetical protein
LVCAFFSCFPEHVSILTLWYRVCGELGRFSFNLRTKLLELSCACPHQLLRLALCFQSRKRNGHRAGRHPGESSVSDLWPGKTDCTQIGYRLREVTADSWHMALWHVRGGSSISNSMTDTVNHGKCVVVTSVLRLRNNTICQTRKLACLGPQWPGCASG